MVDRRWDCRAPLGIALWIGFTSASAAWASEPARSSPIQISPDGATVWVANPDADSVGKIATASDTLLGEFPVGDNPRSVAIAPASGEVYVTNQGSQDLTPKPSPETVMRLSSAGGVTATYVTPFGCAPFGVVLNENAPGGPDVYVTCERTQQVLVLDAALSTLEATIPLAWPDPRNMAISADRTRLYVAHFLTREPGRDAHVTEIDTATNQVVRVLAVPPDTTTCETINSGTGVLNLVMGITLMPSSAPAAVANQLWVGGVMQNNLTKGMFKRDRRFGGHAEPLLCDGGVDDGQPCTGDRDCEDGACIESFTALSRNLYKASFHDITRFEIAKIDLTTGAVVGKIDVDEANQPTDVVVDATGTTAFAVDQFFNSLHIFNTTRGQSGNPTTLFASVSRFGPGGANPAQPCQGGAFLTQSELPFIVPPQVQIVPISADPRFVGGAVALTGNEYDVTTGAMRAVPDGIGTVPHGVALTPDGAKLYVANFLSRNVSVVRANAFFCSNGSACQSRIDCGSCAPRLVSLVPSTVGIDPLPPQLLDGKILFHTAARDASVPNGIGLANAAPLFNRDDPDILEPVGAIVSTSHDASYVACISCHPEGGMDGRTWDFSQFGASLRNTMDLRGRASLAPGVCSAPAGQPCTTDSECANFGVGTCSNDASVICELDIQCGACGATSPTPGLTCMADRQCGGVCSHDGGITCGSDGDCGGRCREDGVTPCSTDSDCAFGCEIVNTCVYFPCDTQTCDAAKCRPGSPADIPRNVTDTDRFFNPMMTVHWNADRDEAEDFEFTYRSLLGAGDCDGVEEQPARCIGGLVMRSNVAKPQEANPDLAEPNRGLSPRLDHMADYIYSLTGFVRNPNLDGGPSADAVAGGKIFASGQARCLECHDGPSAANQHFTDKRPTPSHPAGAPGGPDVANPFVRHNVGTFNAFDLTDPFEVASDIGQFQNAVLPIPGTRGPLTDYVTPTIVDAWNSAPYNHDGAFATLLHGVMPCDDALDDCGHPDAGKNVSDRHGTTSNLTPRQLRLLAAFLLAPHNPTPGAVAVATPFTRLDRVLVGFQDLEDDTDDRLELKGAIMAGPFAVAGGALDEPIVLSVADVDHDSVFERTVPAGALLGNATGSRFVFSDPTLTVVPGIRAVQLVHRGAGPEWRLKIKARGLDLGMLDKNHLTVALEIGSQAFVRTRTFDADARRTQLRLVERRLP